MTANTKDSLDSGTAAKPDRGTRPSTSVRATPFLSVHDTHRTEVWGNDSRAVALVFLEGARRNSCWFLCDPLDGALVEAQMRQLPQLFPAGTHVHPPVWQYLPGGDPRFALLLVGGHVLHPASTLGERLARASSSRPWDVSAAFAELLVSRRNQQVQLLLVYVSRSSVVASPER